MYLFSIALTPFFISIFLAYLNRPAATFLENKVKLSTTLTSSIVVILNLLIFSTLLAFFIPTFYRQTSIFVNRMPLYQEKLNDSLHQFHYWLGSDFTSDITLEAKSYLLKILDLFF